MRDHGAWPHDRAIDSNARELLCIPCCPDLVFHYSCSRKQHWPLAAAACSCAGVLPCSWVYWSPLVLSPSNPWGAAARPLFSLSNGEVTFHRQGSLLMSQDREEISACQQFITLGTPSCHREESSNQWGQYSHVQCFSRSWPCCLLDHCPLLHLLHFYHSLSFYRKIWETDICWKLKILKSSSILLPDLEWLQTTMGSQTIWWHWICSGTSRQNLETRYCLV